MGKHFFDYEDGSFGMSLSGNMLIDSDGDLMKKMSDNMAMDLDSGELHTTSSWDDDEDDSIWSTNNDDSLWY